MVLLIHIGACLGASWTGVGAAGVQLFFVLSGYLGIQSYERLRNKSKETEIQYALKYYRGRAKRILPAYYFALLFYWLYALIQAILSGNSFSNMISVGGLCGPRWIRYLFLLQCLIPGNNYGLDCNIGALWTMSAFALFYLVIPIIYKGTNRFYKSIIILSVLLILDNPLQQMMIRLITEHYPPAAEPEMFARTWAVTQLYCFWLGICVYYAVKEKRILTYVVFLLGILVVTALCYKVFDIIFTLILLTCCATETETINPEDKKLLGFISKGTWPVYLFHSLVLEIDKSVLNALNVTSKSHQLMWYVVTVILGIYYVLWKKEKEAQ